MTLINNKTELKIVRKKLRKSLTPAESILWNYLKKSGLGVKFRRQHSIGHFVLDFYCPKLKFAIELDGATHNLEHVFKRDQIKNKFMFSLGIYVLHIKSQEVIKNLEGVVGEIKKYL